MLTDAEMLDYGKPPPGWSPIHACGYEDGTFYRCMRGGTGYRGETIEEVKAAAWAHYKTEHDPPGMRVIGTGDADQTFAGVRHFFLSHTGQAENSAARAEARVVAWAWHDRRLALAGRVLAEVSIASERLYGGLNVGLPSSRAPLEIWPRCLTWTDEQVAEVEAWMQDRGQTMPTVLHDAEGENPC